jgi:hypothetical protein
MDSQSVLLWIESDLAFSGANFEDRKSNSGFNSVVFPGTKYVPVGNPRMGSGYGSGFGREFVD